MKKHFIMLSTFAALLLSATLLTGCGEEVQELADNGNNGETVTETTVGENCTLFSTGDDGTRTALGYDRKFYWSEGDQIYVNTDGDNYKKTVSSTLSGTKERADFVLEGVSLTAEKCSVVYIGNGTTAATATKNDLKVKIEATQTQAAWGDTAHIGRAGDCGVAEATKDKTTGKYSFNLRHKASYLVIQPYRPTGTENPDWKLTKIEIIANGTNLAGTYDFGTGELVGAGSSNTIEFNCGTGGFVVPDSASWAGGDKRSCFVVIQPSPPGTTHELTIRYTVKVTKKPDVLYFDPNGINENGIFIIDKPIAARQYAANVVTTIKHKLEINNNLYYYQWDALNPYGSPSGAEYNSSIIQPTNASEIAARSAKQSCKDMPNANEMYWYIVNGDPHWDETTPWSIDGGLNEYTGGLWLKKRETILAEGKTFRDDIGKDGYDMRIRYRYLTVEPSQVVLSVAERSKYFFLPALGDYWGGRLFLWRSDGLYWSSSPYPGTYLEAIRAYYLSFSSSFVQLYQNGRQFGYTTGSQWFR